LICAFSSLCCGAVFERSHFWCVRRYRLGRDFKQTADAGLIRITAKWTPVAKPAPLPSPVAAPEVVKPSTVFPPGFDPANFTPVDLAAPSEYNLTGEWRVYTKDHEGKERGYWMRLEHHPDCSLTGRGEAAHMQITIRGAVQGSVIRYQESWDGLGNDNIEADLDEKGSVFQAQRDADHHSSLTIARRASTITKASHPQFFLPYYNLTGAWRVFVEYNNGTTINYNMDLQQDEKGLLTGSGRMGNMTYTLNGTFDKNIVHYSEHWSGSDPNSVDTILATLNPSGSYFKCSTRNCKLQEAKRIDSMSPDERIRYGVNEHNLKA